MRTNSVRKINFLDEDLRMNGSDLAELKKWFNETPFDEIVNVFNSFESISNFKQIISNLTEVDNVDLNKLECLSEYIDQEYKDEL